MTTATVSLTDFLLRAIAEDEAVARAAIRDDGVDEWVFQSTEPVAREVDGKVIVVGSALGSPATMVSGVREVAAVEHIARHDPARVLAGCEAHRRIVERHAPTEFADAPGEYACVITPNAGFWPCADLLDLAAIYADSPGYREEWAL